MLGKDDEYNKVIDEIMNNMSRSSGVPLLETLKAYLEQESKENTTKTPSVVKTIHVNVNILSWNYVSAYKGIK